MARKRTGLRNKYRSGRSSYSIKGKGREADRYGAWHNGVKSRDEVIAGRTLLYKSGENTIEAPKRTLN